MFMTMLNYTEIMVHCLKDICKDNLEVKVRKNVRQRYVDEPGSIQSDLYDYITAEDFDELFDLYYPQACAKFGVPLG